MKKQFIPLLGAILLLTTSCGQSKRSQGDVISQRYIHKYGYDVAREEWESQNYPGQVLTTMRNGVTITATYEEGILHGPYTQTYAHSLTPQTKQIFEHGQLTKKTSFDIRGIPTNEEEYLSPTSVRVTAWYSNGTPLHVEEYEEDALVEGSYYTQNNELESRVQNGDGVRTSRSSKGELLAKDQIQDGYVSSRETFHLNGVPNSYIGYRNGKIHGEKKSFGNSGDPLSIENYQNGKLHGLATYYQNGNKYHEVPYHYGKKEGIERYFIDGDTIVEEIEWHDSTKHGPSYVYLDGYSRSEWYYNGQKVASAKFKELVHQEKLISEMNARSHRER